MSGEPQHQSTQPTVVRKEEADEYYFREGCYILELHNSPNDASCSIARARITVGQCTRLHSLKGIVERYYIQSGQGTVRVGDCWSCVQAGTVVVIPEDTPQCLRNTGHEDIVFLAICTPRFQHELYSDLEEEGEPSFVAQSTPR